MTVKRNFYLPILTELKLSTNLLKIQKKLNISKQNLAYYLRGLKRNGYIVQKGRGWYEPTEKSKNSTKYHKFLQKDFIRGHAYVWKIEVPQEIKDWNKRIEILEKNNFKFKLVGVLKKIPSIKVLGRRVWLCNKHIRVFDKPKSSYYGQNAIESKKSSFYEILLIVRVLNNKLSINLKPKDIYFQKEHYALIKNDLAIDHNKRREQVHVSDEFGEWLLIDDSLGEGGELENIGKKAFQTNIPMQKWWNDNKKHNFKVTPTFLLESMNQVTQNQIMFAQNIERHMNILDEMRKTLKAIQEKLK